MIARTVLSVAVAFTALPCTAQMKLQDKPPQLLVDAEAKSNPCVEGAAPFTLVADFTSSSDGITGQGKYALLWAAKDKWRIEIRAGDFHTTRTRNGDDTYQEPGEREPQRALWLRNNILPGCLSDTPPGLQPIVVLGNDKTEKEAYPATTVSVDKKANITRILTTGVIPQMAAVQTSTGLLLVTPSAQYSDYQPFRTLQIAREGAEFEAGKAVAQFKVVSVTDAPASPNKEFIIPNVEPGNVHSRVKSYVVTSRPKAIVPIHPQFSTMARNASIHGVVQVGFVIDTSGNIVGAHVTKSSGSTLLDAETLRAVNAGKFEPFLVDGKPKEINYTYTVTFNGPSRVETFGLPPR